MGGKQQQISNDEKSIVAGMRCDIQEILNEKIKQKK